MASYLPGPIGMRILVTGGSGVVGRSTITELMRRGHSVRLLSRNAAEDVAGWPAAVEAWPGDVGAPASIHGAAESCQAVVHLVGIVEEQPPELTFERINVAGTRVVLDEAQRAGCGRFIFVSSLGIENGHSPYHASKAAAEGVVRQFGGEWVIIRPGAVYGPGDEHLSRMLHMVRALPAVPAIGNGSQRFQPVWHEDLAKGLAIAVDHPGIVGRTLEVAGNDVITQRELVDRMRELTGRSVPVIPVPEFLASLGVKALNAIGVAAPLSESQLDMLREENIIADGGANGFMELGVTPTPLAVGLRRFVDEQPIQLPEEGVGALQRKTFKVEVVPSRYDAEGLFEYLRLHLLDLMPSLVNSNPEASNASRIVEGATLTLALPVRGHIQVRVVEAARRHISLMTMEGHPLAGVVRFMTTPIDGGVGFEIQVLDRPSSILDWMLMRPIGDRLQESTWEQLAESVGQVAGAASPVVRKEARTLDDSESAAVEQWARRLAQARDRRDAAERIRDPGP